MGEGKESNEFLITRHSQFIIPINIINVYGEQENRTSASDLKDNWNEIVEEMLKIEAKGEHVMLIGDFNKHIGNVIPNNHDRVTAGGKLVRDLLESDQYILLNGSPKEVDGPFTREDPSDPKNNQKKSVLDLIIISKGLYKYVESLTIDKYRKFTPCHSINKSRTVYPDHYALLLKMKNIPKQKEKPKKAPKKIIWNTNVPDGWKKY